MWCGLFDSRKGTRNPAATPICICAGNCETPIALRPTSPHQAARLAVDYLSEVGSQQEVAVDLVGGDEFRQVGHVQEPHGRNVDRSGGHENRG